MNRPAYTDQLRAVAPGAVAMGVIAAADIANGGLTVPGPVVVAGFAGRTCRTLNAQQ